MRRRTSGETHEPFATGTLPAVFELIGLITQKFRSMQRRTTREAGLTPAQYYVMTLLWTRDAWPFKDLAAATHYAPATITTTVDALEQKGLVARRPNPRDRRGLLLTLTKKGAALRRATPTLDGMFQACCAGLEPQEIRELDRLLRRLHDSMAF